MDDWTGVESPVPHPVPVTGRHELSHRGPACRLGTPIVRRPACQADAVRSTPRRLAAARRLQYAGLASPGWQLQVPALAGAEHGELRTGIPH